MKQIVNDYFSVFSRKKLFTFLNIYKRLKSLNIDPEDLIAGIMELEDERIEQIRRNENNREKEKRILHRAKEMVQSRCPKCNGVLMSKTINIPQGRGNLYGYNTYLVCTSCLYEEYHKL